MSTNPSINGIASMGVRESTMDAEVFLQYLADYRKKQERPQVDETWTPHENGVSYNGKI